jgi:hypothetical protein
MKKWGVGFSICLMLLFACTGDLSAAVVDCPTNTNLQFLVTNLVGLANACTSQDKLFWNFTYTSLGPSAPTASDVSANLIFQPGGVGVDIHGWNFSSTWAQGTSGLANFSLSYQIEVCPNSATCLGHPVPAGSVITAADAVYAPVSTFPPGNEVVTWSNGAMVTLTNGSPGPLPPNGNIGLGGGTVGPLTVTAVFSGTGAITQTTLRFYETVPQTGIPEPTTMLLLGAGLATFGIVRRRRQV